MHIKTCSKCSKEYTGGDGWIIVTGNDGNHFAICFDCVSTFFGGVKNFVSLLFIKGGK